MKNMTEILKQLKDLVDDAIHATALDTTPQDGLPQPRKQELPLAIDRIQTRVHTLGTGEQLSAFKNATLEILLKGGSGVVSNIRWTSSLVEVGIDKQIDGNATVVIKNKPGSVCIITAEDVGTNETVIYALAVKFFVTCDNKKHKYTDALQNHNGNIATPADHRLIYQQWGDLAEYPIWQTDDDYWTQEHDIDEVVVVNVRDGIEDRIKRNILHTNYYMYKI